MNSRERVTRALRMQHPDRAPRDLWLLPGVSMFRRAEVDAVLARYPGDFQGAGGKYGQSGRARGNPNVVGHYTDEWGCTWYVAQDGVVGEVKVPAIADWSQLDSYRMPYELLDGADLSEVEATYRNTDKFVLGGTGVRPFERLQFLRGTENLMTDFAWAPAELYRLRERLHDYNMREIEMWCGRPVDGISFMDDWGSMRGLLIAPKTWREFFKPLYADYCRLIHRAGKYVFFHSDGNIMSIIPDLIEIGVDALNSQLFCMDIEEIGRRFRGQVTFWGEIDRQHILPRGTTDEVRQAVQRVRSALDRGEGGVIAQFEWGNDVQPENALAAYAAWDEPMA